MVVLHFTNNKTLPIYGSMAHPSLRYTLRPEGNGITPLVLKTLSKYSHQIVLSPSLRPHTFFSNFST